MSEVCCPDEPRRRKWTGAFDYTTADTFPAESHEAALDTAMLLDQERDGFSPARRHLGQLVRRRTAVARWKASYPKRRDRSGG